LRWIKRATGDPEQGWRIGRFLPRPEETAALESRRRKAMTMIRKEVISVLGPVDDETVAEIIASGASIEELREAWAWAYGDDALMGQGRPLPGTKVGKLIELLEPEEEDSWSPASAGS
jgi:hypothetical protein